MLISSQTAQCGLGTCVNIVTFGLNSFFFGNGTPTCSKILCFFKSAYANLGNIITFLWEHMFILWV
jgi:hypothetical protein